MSMLFKRIKDWATSITAFRTDDVIPVDGPSGTAKMSKDDLLRVTAENALGNIHSLSDTATKADLVSGNYLALDGEEGTKRLPAEELRKETKSAPSASDFSIGDEHGNEIVQFKKGHIRTKNFNSQEVSKAVGREMVSSFYDLEICDETGHSVAKFENGHIRTKNFNSAKIFNDEKAEELKNKVKDLFVGENGDLGFLKICSVDEFDYNIILCYGQSLSVGSGKISSDVEAQNNCYMLGSSPVINSTNVSSLVLNKLKVTAAETSVNISPVVSAVNDIALTCQQKRGTNKKFIALSTGIGGYTIAKLMDVAYSTEELHGLYFPGIDYGSNPGWEKTCNAIRRIKQICDAEGKTCGVTCVLWVHGEADGGSDGGGTPATSGSYSCNGNTEEYKKRLNQLESDFENFISAELEQESFPAWFVGQVGGDFLYTTGILKAQVSICDNEKFFLCSPSYPVPNLEDGHPCGNGYIWFGELIAKSVCEVLVDRKKPCILSIIDYEKIGPRTIRCYMDVPVAPLRVDDYSLAKMKDFGFSFYSGLASSSLIISKIELHSNFIDFVFTNDLRNGDTLAVRYATYQNTAESSINIRGAGNICDSTKFFSCYECSESMGYSDNPVEYEPKDSEGNSLVGKKYPMSCFCVADHRKIHI